MKHLNDCEHNYLKPELQLLSLLITINTSAATQVLNIVENVINTDRNKVKL